MVEVCVASDFRHVPVKRFSRIFFPRARGIVGMEIAFRDKCLRLAPTRMLAANLGFERALQKFLEEQELSFEDFVTKGRLRTFCAKQYLMFPRNGHQTVELFRGGTLVEPTSACDDARAAELADGIGRWMLSNLAADGALPYKYWPSRGIESPADNAIRRFLASLSLARLGDLRDSVEIREAARRNLRFNLARYFQPLGDGRGVIVESTGAKLGAAALAALAIIESSATEEFAEELAMLTAGVKSLADEEHGFHTFFFPAERDGENWNFYSGEALLFWAELARRGFSIAPSLERCVKACEQCRRRHYRKRNPAFVPWYSQACASLFAQTGERRIADSALKMNDWLLTMQQWDDVEPDLRGRFYDPRRPAFGPPHAASTGAYLEGLVDAIALARALGEGGRTSNYKLAVRRGLRSLRQLQYRDQRDMFYISKPERVLGALRTEAYDNSARLDSAAHALMAAVKLLRPMDFGRHSSKA